MSLLLQARVATAARQVVPAWPLQSFIAVNPLAGHETRPFEEAVHAGAALTRSRESFLADFEQGRITSADLEAALRERDPALSGELTIGGARIAVVAIAALDMRLAEWGAPVEAQPAPSWIDDYLAAWVSRYLSPDALWPMPHRDDGFYQSWRAVARADRSLSRATRRALRDLPALPSDALSWALAELGVELGAATAVLKRELQHLPGWVGYIAWRAEKVGDIDLVSYLAVRLALRALEGVGLDPEEKAGTATSAHDSSFVERAQRIAGLLVESGASREETAAIARVLAAHPLSEHRFTWQKAYELHYRATILDALRADAPPTRRPDLSVVMCIDPRSEGMRRHLERSPIVDTYGFAGFFGVPVRFSRYAARGAVDSLPALLSARHHVTEHPLDDGRADRHVARGRALDAVRRAMHAADSSTTTPFALAEASGWLQGVASVLRTLTPTLHARLHRALTVSAAELESTVNIAESFTLQERAGIAETAVRMMGMTVFAPLVVLAGHSSESANNMYQSALDCGACGGNSGAVNARAAASIFNDNAVRGILEARGISIPDDVVFVAAEHNTVTDRVTLLDRHLIPASHREHAEQFDRLQRAAAERLLTERAATLPGASPRHSAARLRRRAHDWAEVYPELGLAGNAAMIIGPRHLSRDVDLERRVFLHSYETASDPDGTALESIMTAPLVVAQWINHQYYFSALNPETLGAGTKTIHNAVGTIGVLSGNSGDLRRGLPWQSVGIGTELFHEPMRLAVIVQAPLERVGQIVSRNQVLRDLLDNDWISLTARETPTDSWHRYSRYGWKTHS